VAYHAVALHVFVLWFCWIVDFFFGSVCGYPESFVGAEVSDFVTRTYEIALECSL
jgi:hypothetical protein